MEDVGLEGFEMLGKGKRRVGVSCLLEEVEGGRRVFCWGDGGGGGGGGGNGGAVGLFHTICSLCLRTSIGRNGAREGDCKRQRMDRPKTFKVEICFSTKIPINALHQHDPAMSEEALKVLDIILRQHTTKQGSLHLSQSLFQNKSQNGESGGGPSGRGFHTSFQETQIGLTLNLDVYKAVVLKHGPLLDFILESQNVKTMQDIDWEHALKSEDYNVNPMMHACGITISPGFAQLNGRVLQPPKRVYEPAKIKRWAILVEPLLKIFEEESHWTKCSFTVRVDQMFQQMRKALSDNPPEFVLCILAKKTNDNIYVSEVPTMILGLDITRGGTHQPNMPFFATVVGSRQWPSMSRYRATVRVQSPKSQMIDFLFNPQPANEDKGIIWELFQEFYTSSGGRKPEQIFIFRSGAHDSQFDQVLNIELDQIIQGTSRPTHYHVLLDEIGFSADALQELVFALSHSMISNLTKLNENQFDDEVPEKQHDCFNG
ncbi:Protein argonaute 4A [Acorus calamus]|uniref:Protein argonaute 4A n=1 Tax=Acorus calamus TaxID=4465 RepID=A0AAV9CTY2_ACOCL|nr:Protein argonaute 4A [Acorus calamus]